jgi:hypothetical protein
MIITIPQLTRKKIKKTGVIKIIRKNLIYKKKMKMKKKESREINQNKKK